LRVARGDLGSAVNLVLDSYASVSAGLEIEGRCRHLTPSMDAEFAGNRDAIAAYLDLYLLPQTLDTVRASAVSFGRDARVLACGHESDRLVTESFQLSEDLAGLIRARASR
jgi:hypothetical protein